MFAVCVTFEIAPDAMPDFMRLMRSQAETSLKLEPGCHVFDICTDADNSRVFLYELYSDADAFGTHLQSVHFRTFDATVAALVRSKAVSTFPTVIRS
jgi:quinol monooxygenase YgiN